MVAVVPFCCCNLHAMMPDCDPCGDHKQAATDVGHDHDSGHEHAAPPSQNDCSGPCNHREAPGEDDCTCDSHKKQSLTLAPRLAIDFVSAIPVAIISSPEMVWAMLAPGLAAYSRCESNALRKPLMSLLCQHCALIV